MTHKWLHRILFGPSNSNYTDKSFQAERATDTLDSEIPVQMVYSHDEWKHLIQQKHVSYDVW